MPKDCPQSCYYYFCVWIEKKEDSGTNIFDEILKKISQGISYCCRKERKTSFVIVQSVKNTDTAKQKVYYSGENIWNQTAYYIKYY